MPIYEVEAPDGRVLEIEGDTPPTEAQLDNIFQQMATPQAPGQPGAPTAQAIEEAAQQPEPDRGLGDAALGAFETAATIGTGALSVPISGLVGLATYPYEAMFGEGLKGSVENIEDMQRTLTYRPRTEAGQEYTQAIGDVVSTVSEPVSRASRAAGRATTQATGSPVAGGIVQSIPELALEAVGLRGTGGIRRAQRTQLPEARVDDVAPEAAGRVLTGQEAQRAARFEEAGVRPTAGQIEQDLPQLKQEQQLLEASSDAGEQMRVQRLEQSREIRKYLEGAAPERAENVGQAVKDAIQLRESSAKHKRNQAYEKLAEVTQDIDVPLSRRPIVESMIDEGEMRDFSATNPGQYNALSGLFEEFGIIPSQNTREALSISNAERFRKRLNSIERADTTGATSVVVAPIRRALDEEFDSASKALEVRGEPSVSEAAKQARLSNVALKTEFDEKGLVSQLIGEKKRSRVPQIETSTVYQKLAANATPVEQFDSVVKSLDRAGSKGKYAKSEIKASMVYDLIDSAYGASSRKIGGEKVFGPGAYLKRLDQLRPKLEKIMTPSEMRRLEIAGRLAEDITPPSGAVPKGSAGFFIDNLDKVGLFAVLDKIPGAGPIFADQIKSLARAAKDKKTFNRAIEKSPQLKKQRDWIINAYPALAATLGIGYLVKEPQEEK